MLIDEEDAASAVDSEFDCVVVGAAASVAVGSGVFEAERRERYMLASSKILKMPEKQEKWVRS